MAGLYFEEFEVGQEFHHEFSRTVTEMDNTMFSLLTMNPQPLHLDAHFSENTEFGQRLFNSLYTLGIMIGMSVHDTTLGTTVGNLGMGARGDFRHHAAIGRMRLDLAAHDFRQDGRLPVLEA